MPQHNQEFEASADAAKLEEQLLGLGRFSLQADKFRLTLPMPIYNRLGPHRHRPFVLSIWGESRLRIVPRTLWTIYVLYLRTVIHNQVAAEDLISSLNQTCV